jgi:hypothetical protein
MPCDGGVRQPSAPVSRKSAVGRTGGGLVANPVTFLDMAYFGLQTSPCSSGHADGRPKPVGGISLASSTSSSFGSLIYQSVFTAPVSRSS